MSSHERTSERLFKARLYLCTDARRERGDFAEFIEAALAGGVEIIQLRDKGSIGEKQCGVLEAAQELETLQILTAIARKYDALVAVNDRADIALTAGVDVLHVGQNDLPPSSARAILQPSTLIGRSTHAITHVQEAENEKRVDYFSVGPCWTTPTKPGRKATGLELVRYAASNCQKPWFAIGGIDLPRLDQVLEAGAQRVAVVRAITQAVDPYAAALAFSKALSTNKLLKKK